VLAKGTVATAALSSLLTGCGYNYQSNTDLVNIAKQGATSADKLEVIIPYQLKSYSKPNVIESYAKGDAVKSIDGRIVDLYDPKQVAEAMGLTLDGTKDQFLYNITLSSICEKERVVAKTIPVTVATVKEGADLINNLEDRLMSDRARETISRSGDGKRSL
jgi:hypothetical protein